MKPPGWLRLPMAALLWAGLPAAAAPAVRRVPHIGYVYPAGGQRGETVRVTVGGQFIDGAVGAYASGAGIEVSLIGPVDRVTPQEAQQLRHELSELRLKYDGAPGRESSPASRPSASDSGVAAGPGVSARPALRLALTAEDKARFLEIQKRLSTFIRNPSSPAISEAVVVEVRIAPDASPGRCQIRIQTPIGLTNPLDFHIGGLPEFVKEAASLSPIPKQAVAPYETSVALPVVLNGQILPGGVDRYRFEARKGQRLVAAVSARKLIPYLADAVPGWFQAAMAVYDPRGRELAYADDFRFDPDPALCFEVPEDGVYTVEIKDAIYRGREDFVYRITLGEAPWITDIFPLGGRAGASTEVEVCGWGLPAAPGGPFGRATVTMTPPDDGPGRCPLSIGWARGESNRVPFAVDTLAESIERETAAAAASKIVLPVIINGRIDVPGDVDGFRFDGRKGQDLVAEVTARRLGSPLDSVLTLLDASGKVVASNDDFKDPAAGLVTHHADSYLRVSLPADGAYTLRLSDRCGQGGAAWAYRLRVSPPRPGFVLRITPSSVRFRGGRSEPFTVHAIRRDGFDGAIALCLRGAPEGLFLSGGSVPAGKDESQIALAARGQVRPGVVALQIDGWATIDGVRVTQPAVPADSMMQAFAYHHLAPAQQLLIAVLAGRDRRADGARGPSGRPTDGEASPAATRRPGSAAASP